MKKIETLITANINRHPNFEEYFKIVSVIQNNVETNPDICIEACKSLIEGVSKTVLSNLDKTISSAELDDFKSVEKLFKTAMTKLSDACDAEFEGDFVIRYSGMIQVIGEIRNKRGDISHGRLAPKPIFSSSKLAFAVANMTESILEYILEHYFQLDLNPIIKLDFDSDDMIDYNLWLDESIDFPIAKARYSRVLYDNDYDEYESSYIDYLKSIEIEDSEIIKPNLEQPIITPVKVETPASPFMGDPIETLSPESPVDVEPIPEQKTEVIQLVNNFDATTYWTEERIEYLYTFAEAEEIISDKLNPIIDEYLFSGKRPLRDAVVECLNEKPALKDRAKIVDVLTDKIIAFAIELNELTD